MVSILLFMFSLVNENPSSFAFAFLTFYVFSFDVWFGFVMEMLLYVSMLYNILQLAHAKLVY